jgi:AcrR family transcriptional regulator
VRSDAPAKREIKREAKRRALLDAARRVALEGGADALTMRAVAAEAGVALGAAYTYFAGKDDLARALLTRELGQLARRMREADGDLGEMAALAQGRLASDPLWAALAPSLFTQDGAPDRAFTGKLIQALTALRAGLAPGGARSEDDLNIETVLLAAAIAGLVTFDRAMLIDALGLDTDDLLARLVARFGE